MTKRSFSIALCGTAFLASLAWPAPAVALPGQFTQQGRLLDDGGSPLEGEASLTFRLLDAEADGTVIWSETLTLTLENGFYSAVLGADTEDNPLDVGVLDQAPLWLQIARDDGTGFAPSSPVHAVPYATMAEQVEAIDGGAVDAAEIAISGAIVIDSDGSWVGSGHTVSWAEITDKPIDIEVDIDTVLSRAEVLGIIDSSTLDLGSSSSVSGRTLLTTLDLITPSWPALPDTPVDFADGTDADTLIELRASCLDGEVAVWDDELLTWRCGVDVDTVLSSEEVRRIATDDAIDLATDTTLGTVAISVGAHISALDWSSLLDIPADFLDGLDADTQLSDASVVAAVTSAALELLSSTTLSGSPIATGIHTTILNWSVIAGIPDGLRDGIDNDTRLTDGEVEAFVEASAIDLAADTTMGGSTLSTGSHTTSLSWDAITEVPEGLADADDADTQLSLETVIAWVEAGRVDLSDDSTIGGEPINTGSALPAGTVAMWSGATIPDGWTLCNGSDGTPDLRDRFVLGAGGSYSVGNTGGGTSSVGFSTGSAEHYGTSGLSVVTSVSGGRGLPPYYALAYIMRQ